MLNINNIMSVVFKAGLIKNKILVAYCGHFRCISIVISAIIVPNADQGLYYIPILYDTKI